MCPAARGARKESEQVRKFTGLPRREKRKTRIQTKVEKRERGIIFICEVC